MAALVLLVLGSWCPGSVTRCGARRVPSGADKGFPRAGTEGTGPAGPAGQQGDRDAPLLLLPPAPVHFSVTCRVFRVRWRLSPSLGVTLGHREVNVPFHACLPPRLTTATGADTSQQRCSTSETPLSNQTPPIMSPHTPTPASTPHTDQSPPAGTVAAGAPCPSCAAAHTALGSASIRDDTNDCFSPAPRRGRPGGPDASAACPAGSAGGRKRSGTAAAAPVTPEESARATRGTIARPPPTLRRRSGLLPGRFGCRQSGSAGFSSSPAPENGERGRVKGAGAGWRGWRALRGMQ